MHLFTTTRNKYIGIYAYFERPFNKSIDIIRSIANGGLLLISEQDSQSVYGIFTEIDNQKRLYFVFNNIKYYIDEFTIVDKTKKGWG